MLRVHTWPLAAVAALAIWMPARAGAQENWDMLGTRRVSFATERDIIDVGRRDGLFNAIRIDVQDGDLEMFNIRVIFGDGAVWSPDTRVNFRERSRSRVIDLPGDARAIRRIEFWYRSRFRRGEATVAVYGRRAGPLVPPMSDDRDWEELGARQVDFRFDHDVIRALGQGRFRRIRFAVDGGDLEMYNVTITFGDGQTFSPATRLFFREGSRSRMIDLPGQRRAIRRIDFSYRSLLRGGRGRATVHVYGRR